jgi:hypothetical protein
MIVMQSRFASFTAALAVLLVATAIALLMEVSFDPHRRPGQTWSHLEFGGGQTVRLLDSGDYIAEDHCDICYGSEEGRWVRIRDAIVLVPSSPDYRRRAFHARRVSGCVVLVPDWAMRGPNFGHEPQTYLRREGDACRLTARSSR